MEDTNTLAHPQPPTLKTEQGQDHSSSITSSMAEVAVAAAASYESTHVHSVYEAIAPHFSSTRHKPWPLVSSFLLAQRPGSIGLDVGCGNGKYLPVNPELHILGSDRSASLAKLARHNSSLHSEEQIENATATKPTGAEHGFQVSVADGLALPYRQGSFDFIISVAVMHHLSTRERRQQGITALLECLRLPESGLASTTSTAGSSLEAENAHSRIHDPEEPLPRALVYVWALEQASSRRGWDEGSEQDTLVPWVMRTKGKPSETFQRYYHLYRKGELEEDVCAAGGIVLDSGYEKDNWWVICTRS